MLCLVFCEAITNSRSEQLDQVEQWGCYKIKLNGPTNGNPFMDVGLSAHFANSGEVLDVTGFYDGDGVYRINFMPPTQGIWRYVIHSSAHQLDGQKGSVNVVRPSPGNHGPVHVAHTYHFAYADGTPYKQIGTTCYVWHLQDEALQKQTLNTLSSSPFNKIRFCVFPKHYDWNTNEPAMYPFEGIPPTHWDTTRLNPAYFRHLEDSVAKLSEMGIEADIIIFHPYDEGHWGFDRMTAVADDFYLRNLVARLTGYRNVWWSLANEYDFMKEKKESDFERYGEIISKEDTSHHLLSIHNGQRMFNQTLPWITHASIQNGSAVEDAGRAVLFRDVYRKPIVFDEVKYEGNLPKRWGNLSAEELVFRFWEGTIAGTYVGHGETYLSPDDIIWWAKGGVLKGQSVPRIAFLKKVLDDAPGEGIEPIDKWQNATYGGQASLYYLVYLGKQSPASWEFELPKPPQGSGIAPADGMRFKAEVLDTWDMSVISIPGEFVLKKKNNYFYSDKNGRNVPLPSKPYMAIRIKRIPD